MRRLAVLPAVQLHREPAFVAVEVQNEPADDMLTAEFEAIELLSAQPLPKGPLRVGRVSPQATGAPAGSTSPSP